jgi:hypothetical protein
VPQLVEADWDFKQPLVLLGPEVESATGESLRQGIPRFSYLAFNDLRISLGPDLRVEMGNVANFTTGGQLRIGGRLDPSLEIAGVVKLLRGRVNSVHHHLQSGSRLPQCGGVHPVAGADPLPRHRPAHPGLRQPRCARRQ